MYGLKKYFLFILIFFLFTCFADNNSINYNLKINNNLKYFGFTIIDSGYDYPDDVTPKTNCIDEVYEFSNIADIHVDDLTIPDSVDWIGYVWCI